MNWKRRLKRNLLFALLAGVVISAIYWGLLYSNAFHGLAVTALGPAINFVEFHLDLPINPAPSFSYRYRYEELAVNVFLYTFWIFFILLAIDLLQQLKRRLTR